MKTAAALGRRKSRAEADCDIREQLIRLTSSQATPDWKDVPLLYGISTMGSQFRVYIHDRDTKTVTPSIMEVQDRRDSGSGWDSDAPPPSMWAHDLLNEEGEQVLMALIEEVKAMCSTAGLCASLWLLLSPRIFDCFSGMRHVAFLFGLGIPVSSLFTVSLFISSVWPQLAVFNVSLCTLLLVFHFGILYRI
jgi:hypothetical protein